MSFNDKHKIISRLKNLVIPMAIFGALLIVLSIFSYYYGYNTICPIKLVTGFPCPGCGMTRAYLALFRLDFFQAVYYHPLFIIPPMLLMFILFQDIGFVKRVHYSKWFYPLLVAIILIVYIYRMCMFFPWREPLDYLNNNFIKNIWEIIPK